MVKENAAVVIDNGSSMCKAGFAGDDAPRAVFPNCIGHHRFQSNEFAVGDEAQARRRILSLTYPIENGNITNWDDMEKIWQHIFTQELKINPENHAVLITDSRLTPNVNCGNMAEILFEKFRSPAMLACQQAKLGLYNSGRVSGVAISCGHGSTDVVPIFENNVLKNGIKSLDIGGSSLTNYLARELETPGYHFRTVAEREIAGQIKEKLCYVADDFQQENAASTTSSSIEKNFELPDGAVITVKKERFHIPEALFRPNVLGIQSAGIHKLTLDSVLECQPDIHKELFANMVLIGGNSMLPGFPERMQKEITSLSPATMNVKVIAPPERKYSVWIGGSILGSMPTFQPMFTSKETYEEIGPAVVDKMLF